VAVQYRPGSDGHLAQVVYLPLPDCPAQGRSASLGAGLRAPWARDRPILAAIGGMVAGPVIPRRRGYASGAARQVLGESTQQMGECVAARSLTVIACGLVTTTSFWGISTTAWTALTALGTLALAAATVAAVLVSLSSAKKARERDNNLRRQDREHEAELRRQDAAGWEKRRLEEQRDREEYEAREVTISVEADLPQTSPDSRFHRLVTVSTPAIYPIKASNSAVGWDRGLGAEHPAARPWRRYPRGRVRPDCVAVPRQHAAGQRI